MGRCRNTFINTNYLTNKLVTQLIEGCDRAICVYHNSVSHFKQLIDNCMDIKVRFINIEKSYNNHLQTQSQFHSYELYQSALCSIYHLKGASSAAANISYNKRDGSSTTSVSAKRVSTNTKKQDIVAKLPLIAN